MSPTPQPRVFGVAEGVLDHPFVDGARLGDVALLALDDVLRGVAHQAVGRQQLGGGEVELALGVGERGCVALARHQRAVLRLDLGGDLDQRRLLVGGPFDAQHLGAVLGILHTLGNLGIAGPGDVARTLPVGRLEGRQRDPRLGGAGRRLDARRQRVGAPALWNGCVGRLRRGKTRREAEGAGGDAGFQDVTTIHLVPLLVAELPGRAGVPSTGMSEPSRTDPHRTRQRSVPDGEGLQASRRLVNAR